MNKLLKNREQEGIIRYLTQCYRKSSQRLKLHRHLMKERKLEASEESQCDELTGCAVRKCLGGFAGDVQGNHRPGIFG